ncbi:hypothetical protein [Fimbriiglobus ruber]|uniref:Tetratricopeptide repeat protein n=1 Tax=Fimbriiglobus ruber TaxID=1908690 RepID=A0A225DE86_9BACT|nr:hypothetical protein [Fimbriiglobus ruber]OWK34715.1 hypothetical protein FRUB_09557 [Fimbriiglobus ruber]
MTTPQNFISPSAQPSLNDLMNRYLANKSATSGMDLSSDGTEVEPHEVAGGFRASAKTTWDEATAVFKVFGVEPEKLAAPPEWSSFVAMETAAVAVPFAAGVFPQRLRHVPALIGAADLTSFRPSAGAEQVSGFSSLRGWVRKTLRGRSATGLIVASGIAAALGDWTDAEAALTAAEPLCTGAWRGVWENQRAALLWLRGRSEEAGRVWAEHDSPSATAFNRGLTALFSAQTTGAADQFQTATADLPDSSGWCHLAKLYQSLAHARG